MFLLDALGGVLSILCTVDLLGSWRRPERDRPNITQSTADNLPLSCLVGWVENHQVQARELSRSCMVLLHASHRRNHAIAGQCTLPNRRSSPRRDTLTWPCLASS
ncbi:uncharacterized protein BKA78DRAFT_24953 [Phyllosticta capitalensis]|uniref:uncharacterized protein n=1 Tax=Phyllosticta capitalensis TaxID=121624 RepID=UPI00313216FF